MPFFKYTFLELFGAVGSGSPEDPGSDYCLSCVIEADDESQALAWALEVHSDFEVARTMFTETPNDGTLIPEGEIEGEVDIKVLQQTNPNLAVCSIGQLPNWIAPWENCDSKGVRSALEPWTPNVHPENND